jgi:hypothetical protein
MMLPDKTHQASEVKQPRGGAKKNNKVVFSMAFWWYFARNL